MTRVWEVLRSLFLWAISWLHFLIAVPVLIALAVVLDPKKHDWLQRGLCRRIAFLSGAKVVARKARGFDETRTCIFMANHVNLLDPFMLYCAIPQLVRGWELESHFRIPIYGWLMKRFGNVPVPDVRKPKELKRLWRMTQATTITVYLHGTIETKGLHKEDVPALKERVKQIIARPVEASLESSEPEGSG